MVLSISLLLPAIAKKISNSFASFVGQAEATRKTNDIDDYNWLQITY